MCSLLKGYSHLPAKVSISTQTMVDWATLHPHGKALSSISLTDTLLVITADLSDAAQNREKVGKIAKEEGADIHKPGPCAARVRSRIIGDKVPFQWEGKAFHFRKSHHSHLTLSF